MLRVAAAMPSPAKPTTESCRPNPANRFGSRMLFAAGFRNRTPCPKVESVTGAEYVEL
ncbi:MAG: hypothetical protein JWS11_3584 [Cypionkella sp.]|nr:hypothetical protein [Cypionkella sp.]